MRKAIMLLFLAIGAAAPAGSQTTQDGYLSPELRPDLVEVLPPPPAPDSARADADRRIYRESRELEGTPRWDLATSDVRGGMLDHFSCALGARLDEEDVPALHHLIERAGNDRRVVGDAKRHYQSKRPWLDSDLPICEARTEHLAGNGDYPSGHAAHGQHVAMILAALAPDRVTQLLARGREFGESRWVCGSHTQSAAEAGTLAGAVIFAAEMNSEEFRDDLEAARKELVAARAAAPAPEGCGNQ
ncbi:Major phosphate-irrepressible acid phosphatase [Alteriqipengyuania sp. 357]